MPLQPVKDIREYKQIKDSLKEKFEAERTGDQDLFREQSKIFQPLINTQQQTVKPIKDGQDTSATALASALVPFTRELRNRNEQVDMLTEQPFYQQELPAVTSVSPVTPVTQSINVNLDAGLNETDKENLQDMDFELPSTVYQHKRIEDTLKNIKTENRSLDRNWEKVPRLKKYRQTKRSYIIREKTLLINISR